MTDWIFVLPVVFAAFTAGYISGDARGWRRGRLFGQEEGRLRARVDAKATLRSRQQGEG